MSKLSFLASVSQTRSVLEQHGLMTKKALGQHFLINDGIVQRICDLAELTQEDKVIGSWNRDAFGSSLATCREVNRYRTRH